MKRKYLISLIVIFLCFVSVGCGETKTNSENKNEANDSLTTESKSNGVVVREIAQNEIKDAYEITLKTIAVEFVGDTLNFQVVIANETNEDKDFDCSKFLIKTYDGDTLKVNATIKNIKANTSYKQYAFTIDDGGKVQVGDLVYAYYDSTSLGPVEVSEF